MADLEPNEGINALQHPDCRACAERERLNVGLLKENVALKGALKTTNSRTLGEVLDKAVMKLAFAVATQEEKDSKQGQREAADLINSVRKVLDREQAAAPSQHLSVSDLKERIRTERDSYSAAPPSMGTEQAVVVLNGLLAFIEKGGSNG